MKKKLTKINLPQNIISFLILSLLAEVRKHRLPRFARNDEKLNFYIHIECVSPLQLLRSEILNAKIIITKWIKDFF